ncbi:hypothetical protein TDMWS_13120 [Thermodesulfomicrobium sp. WS]|uniref:hypothetical protein n=1 Tax=Thermodesulfomicrobium sp. WS TaxID=3004129 RepID=UPI0024902303|nr:hypothetical protein [Thermodesulfomicrobium sp. WS]BDV01227.1 hypothetical protein TDMWS_13120 [Thermodesulfomicrobium sp. WS]
MNLFFDLQDHALLELVADVLSRATRPRSLASLMAPALHPHGIKELAAPRGLRIAYAVASLLGSLAADKAPERLAALTMLRDEVLLTADVRLPRNTARVLMQIMKDLIRHQGDTASQLRLAHAFRAVSTGRPREVRRALAHYHLLEMPEEWNQVAFDDHVHDANTKGRKTPTHLVMDAWIKGIRHLTVVYYNFVTPEVAEELLQAAAILDMRVRIGIEVRARFRDLYARFTWEPFSLPDPESFRRFLAAPAVQSFMEAGRQVSRYHQRYVFGALDAYNTTHRRSLGELLGFLPPPISQEQFLQFVGEGQPSLLHLARHIETSIHNAAAEHPSAHHRARVPLEEVDSEYLIHHYLQPCRNPHLHDPTQPSDDVHVPALLRRSPKELLQHLAELQPASRFVLNPSNLTVADVLEIVAQCNGLVTDLEIYNLKTLIGGRPVEASCAEAVEITNPQRVSQRLAELQQALGDEHIIALKRVVRSIVWDYHQEREAASRRVSQANTDAERKTLEAELAAMTTRCEDLLAILEHLPALHQAYAGRPMGVRAGSSSTGQSRRFYGMGLAVAETLPQRAQAAIHDPQNPQRLRLPLRAHLVRHLRQSVEHGQLSWAARLLGLLPPPSLSWEVQHLAWSDGPGNVVTLGGLGGSRSPQASIQGRWGTLNSHLKNILKVCIGFIPAFLTFALTKDWWVLAYGGAFIWFAITGVRNVLQTVLGGGGLKRPSELPWRSLISANRIADSLLFTGFSVPLLDYCVKTLLLHHGLGITVASHPVLLYAIMAAANGLYIFSHNLWRGLPRAAAIGNLFRSIISIPVALLYNDIAEGILLAFGTADPGATLQAAAAILSKLASDTVAGGIEGLADRNANIAIRLRDYRTKLTMLFNTFARLDTIFPEEDVLEMLQTPKAFLDTLNLEAQELEQMLIVNALDLMYFWYYQPRARSALRQIVRTMTQEEWLIFFRSQLVLKRFRETSRMLVDGLVGKNFTKALAFYLDHYESYLRDMERLGAWRRLHAPLQDTA